MATLQPVFDVVVVGAGIAGLHAASLILQARPSTKLLVLERCPQIGGRALTVSNSFDLGGAWSWSDQHLGELASRLNTTRFPQPAAGNDVIVNSYATQVTNTHGQLLACGPGGQRFERGVGGIATALAAEVSALGGQFQLIVAVNSISTTSRPTRNDFVRTKITIVAAPPQLIASNITFNPPLPETQAQTMLQTQTWMYNTGKAIVEYDAPWWREAGLNLCSSGTSSRGGVIDVTWDNSDYANDKFAIGMFVQPSATEAKVNEDIAAIFETISAKPLPKKITVKFWTDVGVGGYRTTTAYGEPILRKNIANRVFFGGTETEREHGHIEGAVMSGKRLASDVLAFLNEYKDKEL